MGKKKKSARKTSKEKNEKKGKTNRLLYVVGAVAVLLIGFIGLRAFGIIEGSVFTVDPQTQAYIERVKKAGLTETRPLLPPERYTGRVARAYAKAVEIPEVLDSIYCYCRCKENPKFRHKNLLTCFTDDHASNCGICMSQMNMAFRMNKEGKSISEIRAAEDDHYGKRG